MSKYYVVQLAYELWLAPCCDLGLAQRIEDAKRFPSRRAAEEALEKARQFRPYPDAFVDVLRATVI